MNISEDTRRTIVDYILVHERVFWGELELLQFLSRIWGLKAVGVHGRTKREAIETLWYQDHDLDRILYEVIGICHVDDSEFLKFVEQCLHPLVQSDDLVIAEWLRVFNDVMAVDGFRLEPTAAIAGRPVYRARQLGIREVSEPGDPTIQYHYDVVLSFAGEQRVYIEQVAKVLTDRGVNVWYDAYEEAAMWGKDLYEHLASVYRDKARYCVMFASKEYAAKVWTNHERKAAQERALRENHEYVLPVRIDDTPIPGLSGSVHFVRASTYSARKLADLVLRKLGLA